MIAPRHGLSGADLGAIADLEARVVAGDGGRLKLEWSSLRSRSTDAVSDLLAWEDDRLIGFAGLYSHGGSAVEIAGMVDPGARRRGLGGALLDAALALCAERGGPAPLLIVPRHSAGGRTLAVGRGGELDHSEHALVLRGEPAPGPSHPGLTLRTARREDVAEVIRILSSAFGYAPTDIGERLLEPHARTLAIVLHGELVGTLRVTHAGAGGGVYGFAVDAAHRGRGIGGDALRRACRELREQGATEVGLEVEVENDRALGLYTSLGFTPVSTEDYWRLAG